MVTIPTREDPGGVPRPVAAPGIPTAPPGQLFGDRTRAFGEAQRLVGQAREQFQRQAANANQISVTNADLQLTQAKNRLLWDPETGAMKRGGPDALAAIGETKTAFDQEAVKIGETLTNDEQRQAFEARVQYHKTAMDGALQKNAFSKMQKWDEDTTTGFIQNEIETIRNNADDHLAIIPSVMRITETVTKFAERTGMAHEKLERMLDTTVSAAHTAAIKQLILDKKFDQAKERMRIVSGSLIADDKAELKPLIERESLIGESQFRADEAMAQFKTPEEAIDHIKKTTSGRMRTMALDVLRQNIKDRQNAIFQRIARDMDWNMDQMEANKTIPLHLQRDTNPVVDPQSLARSGEWGYLSKTQRDTLGQMLEPPDHDPAKYVRFQTNVLQDPTWAGRLSEDEFIAQIMGMNATERTRALDARKKAVQAIQGNPAGVNQIRQEWSFTMNRLRQFAAIPDSPSDYDERDNALLADVHLQVVAALENAQAQNNGQELSQKQKLDNIDELFTGMVFFDPGFFRFEERRPLITLTAEERKQAFIRERNEIPLIQQAIIDRQFQEFGPVGETLSNQRMVEIYNAKIQGNHGLAEALIKVKEREHTQSSMPPDPLFQRAAAGATFPGMVPAARPDIPTQLTPENLRRTEEVEPPAAPDTPAIRELERRTPR